MRGWYQRKTPEQRRDWWRKRDQDAINERQRTERRRNPEKVRARDAVANAIRRGKLSRLPCEVCGEVKSEAHHGDYSKPLEVRWLCRPHHLEAD